MMSLNGVHRTSNKKFSNFCQLLNRHPQIKIFEASHFCIISELVACKLNFLSKQTGICLTQKLQETCIWPISNLNGKNEFNI